MSAQLERDAVIRAILPILRGNTLVLRAALFGSLARGEAGEGSDVDLLVRFGQGMTLFKLDDLKDALEKTLGRPVDLVSERSLNRHLRPHVERERIVFYERP